MDVTSVATSVTPTTTITSTQNGTTVTFLYPCVATASDGCYVKKNAGSNHKPGFATKIWALVLVFMASAMSVLADDTPSGALLRFDNMTAAIDTITEMEMATDDDSDDTDYYVLVDDEVFGISNFTIEYPTTNVTKRWNAGNAPLGASWTQRQVAQQGTYWGGWYPASCVHQNGYGAAPVVVTVTQSSTYSATWDAGFDLNFGTKGSLNIGYSVTKTFSKSEAVAYTVPAYSYGQVWQQQLVVWQDQQHQKCHKYHYGKGGIKCGAWSGYVRGNMPVTNGVSFGWSTGYDKMNFGTCGGGS
ncbi:hypothetical protein OXX69_004639 [Metschnikowia pulcherrima]